MQHINEYVSEDIIEVVKELSSILNSEELKQSLVIAKELRENVTSIEVCLTEEATGSDIEKMQKHQAELKQELKNSLSCLSETTLEHLHELEPFIDKEKFDKVVLIAENLKTELDTKHITQPGVLQVAIQEEPIIGTEFETTQVVNESKENTAKPSLAGPLALVEPVSRSAAVVEPIECEKEVLVVEEIPVNMEIKQDLTVEPTSICIEDEAIVSVQSKTLESDPQFPQYAATFETRNVNQQNIEEQTKNDLITQESDVQQPIVVKTSVQQLLPPETEQVMVSLESTVTTSPEENAVPATTVAEMVLVSEANIDASENNSIEIATSLLLETVTLEKDLTETTQPVEKSTKSLSMLTAGTSSVVLLLGIYDIILLVVYYSYKKKKT